MLCSRLQKKNFHCKDCNIQNVDKEMGRRDNYYYYTDFIRLDILCVAFAYTKKVPKRKQKYISNKNCAQGIVQSYRNFRKRIYKNKL